MESFVNEVKLVIWYGKLLINIVLLVWANDGFMPIIILIIASKLFIGGFLMGFINFTIKKIKVQLDNAIP